MSKKFDDLLQDIRKLRLAGKKPTEIRSHFVDYGWDIGTVDRALWQLKLRDRKNTFFLQRLKKPVIIAGITLGFAGLVVGTLSFEKYQKNNQKEVAGVADSKTQEVQQANENMNNVSMDTILLRGQPVVSEQAGISFDYPDDWTVTEVAPEESGGVYQWQIEHIENKPIKDALEQKYNVSGTGSEDASTAQLALLNDPLVEKLSTMTINVYKAPDSEVETSLQEWRDKVDKANGQLGYSTGSYESIQLGGLQGYKYITKVAFGQINISTLDVVFIDPSNRRVEVSVYPLNNEHSVEIDKILSSLQIF